MAYTPDNRPSRIIPATIRIGHMIKVEQSGRDTSHSQRVPDRIDHELARPLFIGKTNSRESGIYVQSAFADMPRGSSALTEILPEILGIHEGKIPLGEYTRFYDAVRKRKGHVYQVGPVPMSADHEYELGPALEILSSRVDADANMMVSATPYVEKIIGSVGLWEEVTSQSFPGFVLYDVNRNQLIPPPTSS